MKKKSIFLLLTGLSLSLTGFAHAKDTAAVLSINGLVTPGYSCLVTMNQSSVSLVETPDKLIKQGNNATNPLIIHLSLSEGEQCESLVAEGKLAYRVLGNADNAEGTTLANQLNDSTAASGLGIGLFDANNNPISVNTGLIPAAKDTVLGLQLVQLSNQEAIPGNINAQASIQIERL